MSLLKKFYNMVRSRGTTAADQWIQRHRSAIAELETCQRDVRKRQREIHMRWRDVEQRNLELKKKMQDAEQQCRRFHSAARQAKQQGNLDLAREQLRLELQFQKLRDDLESAVITNQETQTSLKDSWRKMESRLIQLNGESQLLTARQGMVSAGDTADWVESDDLLDSVENTIQEARGLVDSAELAQTARRNARAEFAKEPSTPRADDPDVEELLNNL